MQDDSLITPYALLSLLPLFNLLLIRVIRG
jgi:hypothetical protein